MKNKLEQIDRQDLKVGDVVTAVNLRTGKVLTEVNVVKVWSGTDKGFSYGPVGTPVYDGTIVPHGDAINMVLFRANTKPDFWPPVPGDVWVTGSKIFVKLSDDGYSKGYFIESNDANWNTLTLDAMLKKHPDIRLVYRHGKTVVNRVV